MVTNTIAQRINELKNNLAELEKMRSNEGALQLVLDVSTCPSMQDKIRIEVSGLLNPTDGIFAELEKALRSSLAHNIKNAQKELEELQNVLKN